MAARVTDKQKKKIIADYLETESINAAAKRNGVSWDTAKRILEENGEIEQKLEDKKEQNTADIMSYMESKRDVVCSIIGLGLKALSDPEKLSEASPAQITTALGTLIDKWTALNSGRGPADTQEDDELSKSLKEMAEGLTSDE